MHAQRKPSVQTMQTPAFGSENCQHRAAIRAYIFDGGDIEGAANFEMERAARNAAFYLAAEHGRRLPTPAVELPVEVETDSDPSIPRMLLGAAAGLTVWGFVAWAGAPYAVHLFALITGQHA